MDSQIRTLILETIVGQGNQILVVENLKEFEYWLIKSFEDNPTNELDGGTMYKFIGYNVSDFIKLKIGQNSKSTVIELEQWLENKKTNKVSFSKNQKISIYS
jgi:hypothetical protein